nr:hypothetical protein [Bacillus licheniformis]
MTKQQQNQQQKQKQQKQKHERLLGANITDTELAQEFGNIQQRLAQLEQTVNQMGSQQRGPKRPAELSIEPGNQSAETANSAVQLPISAKKCKSRRISKFSKAFSRLSSA